MAWHPLNIVEVLTTAKTNHQTSSKRRRQNGAIYINGERVQDLTYELQASDRIGGKYVVIRRGKKKYFLLTF